MKKTLKFKGFEFEEDLLEFVNNNDGIELFTITAQGVNTEMYGLWYY